MCGNFKVSVRKMLKYFGRFSVVSKALEEIIQSKNWRPACPVMVEDKYVWFMIRQIFWKTHVKVSPAVVSKGQLLDFLWVRNDLYNLKNEVTNILISKEAWLNGCIMDAVQKLICGTLEAESESNSQKNKTVNYHFVLSHRNIFNCYVMDATKEKFVTVSMSP